MKGKEISNNLSESQWLDKLLLTLNHIFMPCSPHPFCVPLTQTPA